MTVTADSSVPQPGPITRIEAELDRTWRQRSWGAFLRTWGMSVVITAAAGFLIPLVLLGVYALFITMFFGSDARGLPNVLSTSALIGSMAGVACLIITVPVMAIRASQGGPQSESR